MSNLDTRGDWRLGFIRMESRRIGFLLLACGVLSMLSGALGYDSLSRFFTHGAVSLNDLVPGAVFLALGLVLLRVSGGAPLADQMRSIRHWDTDRWMSFALMAGVLLLGMAEVVFGRLLPPWLHYGLLLTLAAALLWLRPTDRSVRS
jgi:hypothetical protein